jgi:hypothetical protein
MKPKTNRAGDSGRSLPFDCCQTPAYALDPLLPYLRREWVIWEPAAGEGNIVDALALHMAGVIGSDLVGAYADPPRNFFGYAPQSFDAIVTNPPYSIKPEWIERCYALGKPFALLVPVETIGTQAAQRLMERYGAELLLLDKRVDFKMPSKGWEGSSAQFPVLWLCWRLLDAPIVYGRLTKRSEGQAHFLEAA